ncbi:hypothetical protein RchiOBHm_Chr1g0330911 [Rosa chinensis]|uniref:Uncharacterized protein n=1 Tax=Rosa chinensis TaxID=74649 RepID=A0A2P6SBG8_ROSCH|nr:hypothetical protein RchiOBHm_Chr1g0330911 [Rosa chinensis]
MSATQPPKTRSHSSVWPIAVAKEAHLTPQAKRSMHEKTAPRSILHQFLILKMRYPLLLLELWTGPEP